MKKSFAAAFIALIISTAANAQDDVLKYSMNTRWTNDVDPENAWPEYPRPQMTRKNYKNLNGYWQYAINSKDEGKPKKYQGNILVPFAVESAISGVKKPVGEENYLWYHRQFDAPEIKDNERLLLHFGAVDWEAVVYINGQQAGIHKGGYDAFSFDITDHLSNDKQEVTVRVWDPSDKGTQARGKQVSTPSGIWYTPVTGIWQTVWLEKVPKDRVELVKLTPDIDKKTLSVDLTTTSTNSGLEVIISARADGKEIATTTVPMAAKQTRITGLLNIPAPRLWTPDDPYLYDIDITLKDRKGNIVDEVGSYFGMRKVSLGKDANGHTRIMLNNEPLFQFGLLDQGWWPDGLYTPPTEEAMLYDVKMTKEMGFNMLRKHVKVEPVRFYYHCDKMGMLVWQDMPNGNYRNELRIQAWETTDAQRPRESANQFETELREMMDELHSFPSILVWVPFNEGWGQYDTERVTEWVSQHDPSRLIDSPSGWADRGVGDVIDVHLYPGPGMEPAEDKRASVLGEFGGLGHPVKDHLWWDKKNWGYLTFEDKKEFIAKFEDLMNALRGSISCGLSAAIYTQTTDVEGEVNGLLTYDRDIVKISPEKLRDIITPLYKAQPRAYVVVPDSELNPAVWKVSHEPVAGNWTAPDYYDLSWNEQAGPFSSYDNFFLDKATPWESEKLFLRKEFTLDSLPSRLYLKHYLPKTTARIFLNGKLLQEHRDQGGRKRHYTHVDLSQYCNMLKRGRNVLAVEAQKSDEQASFDLGLYTTGSLPGKNKDQRSTSTYEKED